MLDSNVYTRITKFIMGLTSDEYKALVFIIALKYNGEASEVYHAFNKLVPLDRATFLVVYNSVNNGQLKLNLNGTGLNKIGITPLFAEILDFMSEDSHSEFIKQADAYIDYLIDNGVENA